MSRLGSCKIPGCQFEIERAIKQAKALFAYSTESITNQAFWLGYAKMFADYDWFENYIATLEQTTPQQLQEIARRKLDPSRRVVGIFHPSGKGTTNDCNRANSSSSIPGPDDITRIQLGNGIVLLARENFQSPSVVINGYMGGGSMHDPDDKLGLALFTTQSLMRGTQKHSQHEIYDRLESAGASLGFGSGVHTITFGGRALVEDLPLILETLAECVRYPVFPTQQLELVRAQMLTSLAIRAQDTEQQATLAFEELLYKDHPYARPEDGYETTIASISRDDITAFHRQHYHPKGMVIAIVGAISAAQILAELQKPFDGWEGEDPLEPRFPGLHSLSRTTRKHISIADKFQTDMIVGTLGPSRASPDYLAAALGDHILGQFGMMGRIGESVRERGRSGILCRYESQCRFAGRFLGGICRGQSCQHGACRKAHSRRAGALYTRAGIVG